MAKGKIIYITPHVATFVRKDIEILSGKYDVITSCHNWINKSQTPISIVRQLFFLLKHVFSVQAFVVMFGGYWSIIPALLGKIFRIPVFIILGGTDCVAFPSIGYGSLRPGLLKIVIRWSYRLATHLVPVSETLVRSKYQYYQKCHYTEQGYQTFFPDVKTPWTAIHNGFDIKLGSNIKYQKVPHTFITTAIVDGNRRFKLKGIDKIFELAKLNPNATFRVVGVSDGFRSELDHIPVNVELQPFLPIEQFSILLEKSEFYLQLSISEGFPNALCEAMLFQCIPIVSQVGAMPKIVEMTGLVVARDDISTIQNAIQKVLNLSDIEKKDRGLQARTRIVTQFPLSKRKEQFEQLFKKYF